MPASGQGLVTGSLSDWTNTSATWHVPPTALVGPGFFYVTVNGIRSEPAAVTIQPAFDGSPCAYGGECESGFCADGVCCDRACDGTCEACSSVAKGSGIDGVCDDIPDELSPDDACFVSNGASCTSAAECESGFCVDGVCCESACAGQCEACDIDPSRGQCLPVVGEPRGNRRACNVGPPSCQDRACDGQDTTRCAGFVGQELVCRAPSCADGMAVREARCDGKGQCPELETVACEPYRCAGDRCDEPPCDGDDDCASGFRCAEPGEAGAGTCVPRQLSCDGAHTVTFAGGAQEDCRPYRCDGTGCLGECESSADCAEGFACSADGRCVGSAPATELEPGCACGIAGRPRSSFAWLVLALTAGLLRRRKRWAAATSFP